MPPPLLLDSAEGRSNSICLSGLMENESITPKGLH